MLCQIRETLAKVAEEAVQIASLDIKVNLDEQPRQTFGVIHSLNVFKVIDTRASIDAVQELIVSGCLTPRRIQMGGKFLQRPEIFIEKCH